MFVDCVQRYNTTWEGDWRIVGQQGSVCWDGGQTFQAQVVSGQGGFFSDMVDLEIPPLDAADQVGSHAGQIADFVDCVRAGRRPETTARDNIKSLAMVFSAIESAEKGVPVKVEW